jgi:hypothetical protein
MEIVITRNTAFARWLCASLLFLSSIGFTQPAPEPNEKWPVSIAQNGFTVEESNDILEAFAPIKLALAGNQAL